MNSNSDELTAKILAALPQPSPLDDIAEPVRGMDYAKRLHLVVLMRTLINLPPSEQAADVINTMIQREAKQPVINHPLMAFLKMLRAHHTGQDPSYLGMAERALFQLEQELEAEKSTAIAEIANPPSKAAQVPPRASQQPSAPAAPAAPFTAVAPQAPSLKRLGQPDVRRVPHTATPVIKPYLIAQAPGAPHVPEIYIPFDEKKGENTVIDRRVYTLLSDMTDSSQMARGNGEIVRVSGIWMGMNGQRETEEGYGFYMHLPQSAGFIELNKTDIKTVKLQLALGYPGTIVHWDKEHAGELTGASEFLAAHQLMLLGYRFLLTLSVVWYTGPELRLVPALVNVCVDRVNKDGTPAHVDAQHLLELHYIAKRLKFVAFTAEAVPYE